MDKKQDGGKPYTDFIDRISGNKNVDYVDTMFDEIAEIELTEGSGVFTNVIAQSIVKGIRKVGKDITRQRNVDKKITLLSQQITMLGGLTLLVLAVSGDKKGTLSKGMSLISIVKSMKKG